jgi:hypothetical protein
LRRVNVGITGFVNVIGQPWIADSHPAPQGETVIVRRFIVPLTLSVMIALCAEVGAQGAFPAPLPNRSGEAPAAIYPPPSVSNPPQQGPASASPFPSPSSSSAAAAQDAFSQGATPLGGGLTASAERQECMEGFEPLRQDAANKAKAIKAARERKAMSRPSKRPAASLQQLRSS